jgi:hypothetical protein
MYPNEEAAAFATPATARVEQESRRTATHHRHQQGYSRYQTEMQQSQTQSQSQSQSHTRRPARNKHRHLHVSTPPPQLVGCACLRLIPTALPPMFLLVLLLLFPLFLLPGPLCLPAAVRQIDVMMHLWNLHQNSHGHHHNHLLCLQAPSP